MLTKADELLCHQIVSTFDHVETGMRNWAEKVMLEIASADGDVMMVMGIGKYPNRNVMDAYACVGIKDKQYTVRSSRELHPDVDSVEVGPISYEVIEPLRKVRARLGENPYGISFDIELEGTLLPLEEDASFTRYKGAMVNNTVRYWQIGRPTGTITVEGKTYEVKPDSWYGWRDRSWGIRAMMGVHRALGSWRHPEDEGAPEPGMAPKPEPPGILGGSLIMEFKDFGYIGTAVEGPDGKPFNLGHSGQAGFLIYPYGADKTPKRIVDYQCKNEFFPDSRIIKSIQMVMTSEDGNKMEVSLKPTGSGMLLFTCGYFGGYKNWWHGKWMGPLWMDGEVLDLTDKKLVNELKAGGIHDAPFECVCNGEAGRGIYEYGVWGDLPKYGIKGKKN